MPTEIVDLELEEVSLVDAGDDPLAKVAIFKRNPEGDKMDEDKAEDLEKMEDDLEVDDEEEMVEGEDKKPTRKSWKAEALAFGELNKSLAEEVETLKAKVADLETAAVEKAAPQEETIDIGGEKVAKSAIPAPVLKKLEELQKAGEAEALRKRAEEVLPNFKGTTDQRGKLLKSIGDDVDLLELLLAADALFAGLFEEVGKTDAKNDLKTPEDKISDLVKVYQEEHKVKDFHKAYAAVIKTAEGRALVLETYKK